MAETFFVCKVGDSLHIAGSPDGLPSNCEPDTKLKVIGREEDVAQAARQRLASMVKENINLDNLKGVDANFVSMVSADIDNYFAQLKVRK